MAFVGGSGTLPADSASSVKHALYHLVTVLVTAGWTRVGEGSDGVGFANEGETAGPYDTRITGAASWGNNGWIRLRAPTGGREIVISFTNSAQYFRLHYSRAAGFSTGAAQTVAPTATDGKRWWDSYSNQYATLRPHAVAQNAPHNGVYYFWFASFNGAALNPEFFILFDPLDEDQSHPDNTVEPVVLYATNTPTQGLYAQGTVYPATTPNYAQGYRRAGESDEMWLGLMGMTYMLYNGSYGFPGGFPVNPYSGGDDLARVPWGRSSYPNGAQILCGLSRYTCFKGVSARAWPDTIGLAGADPRVYLHDLALPWPVGGVGPTI
jgi:hypothetical protein